MPDVKPLPCPLHGTTPDLNNSKLGHWVECVNLCWSGPVCDTPEAATAAWNEVMGR